jgi:hypothetical protein
MAEKIEECHNLEEHCNALSLHKIKSSKLWPENNPETLVEVYLNN